MIRQRDELGPTAGSLWAWRVLLVSLLCCVFEGAVRKWLVGDASIAGRIAYLSKYVVLAIMLVNHGTPHNRLAHAAAPFLKNGMGLLAVGSLFSCLSGIAPVGAILTVLNFFFLPYAAWCAGQQLPADAIRRFALALSCLAILMAPLGVRQFYSPPTSLVNRYSTEGEAINTATVSERIRATGTFSYITGMGEFATTATWAGLVTFSLARTARHRWIGYIGLAAALCCGFVTVSRAVVLICLTILASWTFFGGQLAGKLRAIVGIGLVIATAGVTSERWDSINEIGTTVYRRHEFAKDDSLEYRLWYQFVLPTEAIWIAPTGNGLGTQQAGRSAVSGDVRESSSFESPWARTILELGVLGLVGLLVSLGVAFVPWRRMLAQTVNPRGRIVLIVTGVLLFTRAALGFQFNHIAAYFFWATAACVIALGNRPPCNKKTIHRERSAILVSQ
jgi:hypothetical protein